jgi:hypothetical protein
VEVYQLGPKACFAKAANQGPPRGDDDVAVIGRGDEDERAHHAPGSLGTPMRTPLLPTLSATVAKGFFIYIPIITLLSL